MTKRLDDTFNVDAPVDLPQIEDLSNKEIIVVEGSKPLDISQDELNAEFIALTDVAQHSTDMDDLAKEAMAAYEKTMEYVDNVEEKTAASFLDAAYKFQKNAIDAKMIKEKARQKAADLLLKKQNLDMKKDIDDAGIYDDEDAQQAQDGTVVADRNSVLSMIKNDKNDK